MLSPGSRVGPYEILSPLGAGGMGEVYRARDTRLARDVAIKVLVEGAATHPERMRRFEKEARSASALNHPNIVTVYDIGSSDSTSYIAMELVEGVTVRQALVAGAFPLKKLLSVAAQVADGLAKAHGAGIVHRDLKPENLMVTRDGYAKILDFGLAKLTHTSDDRSQESRLPTVTKATEPGVVMGTVGYMSPEQASGRALDFRSDQFSFGSILYEMATGKRAFEQPTAAETLAAIIREEPEPLAALAPSSPAPLRWAIERCLAKDPEDRYAATRDLSRDLAGIRDHLSEASASGALSAAEPQRRRVGFVVPLAAAVLAALVGGFFVGKKAGDRPIPDFQRLTFRRGEVMSARFAPDGRTIVYSATWDREPVRLFSTRTDGRGETRLEMPEAEVASVSSQGEIAMLRDGTLARVSLAGGAPREMTENVQSADWSPDGKSLAIVRDSSPKNRLEYPIGKVLYETERWISAVRNSPRGDRIAFLASSPGGVSVETMDLSGRRTVLSRGWKGTSGLAWSADGRDVWFTARDTATQASLFAVTLSGRQRMVMRLPGGIALQDVARDGRALLSLHESHGVMRGVVPGKTQEHDLSWHERSLVKDLTPDGKTVLFHEALRDVPPFAIYVRPTDGSPAKRLGEGRGLAISPDGKWVVSQALDTGGLVLLPTGAGEPRVLDTEGHDISEARFFSDGKRLLAWGDGSYLVDLPTGKIRAVAPEGVACMVVSPDDQEAACIDPEGKGVIYAVEGGASRPIPGFKTGEEEPRQWSADGRSLFVGRSDGLSLEIVRLDLATGRRQPWQRLTPSERVGLKEFEDFFFFSMTRDGKYYVYSLIYSQADLYLVTGLE